jgi:hypothetical protein
MKRLLVLGACVLIVIAVAFVGYRAYDRHISGQFKTIVVAVLDPANTEADDSSYLRELRLAVHTVKDRDILADLERGISLWEGTARVQATNARLTSTGPSQMDAEVDRESARRKPTKQRLVGCSIWSGSKLEFLPNEAPFQSPLLLASCIRPVRSGQRIAGLGLPAAA